MFADYSVSINDRMRILNLINDGKLIKYVNQMTNDDVLFLKINVNKFPGPYHISVRNKNWVKEMEMNYDDERSLEDSQSIINSFEEINEGKKDDTITVHIHYTNENFIQTSTYNLQKNFFNDENNVIGELIEENVYYNNEFMKKSVKEIFENDRKNMMKMMNDIDNDNIIVMFGVISIIQSKEEMKKYLKKRLINIDLNKKILLFVIQDGYRYHGISFTNEDLNM